MPKQSTLRALPNPFAFLDHEGLPAATYPLDPDHAGGARRWVGTVVDLSTAPDGQPRTRRLPQKGDATAALSSKVDGKTVVRKVFVDRAQMKRIRWAHEVIVAAVLPDAPHYRLGFRQGALLAADAATAATLDMPFVEPAVALVRAAATAIEQWTAAYGEPPPIDDWPANLRAASGIDAPEPPAEEPEPVKAPALAAPVEPHPALPEPAPASPHTPAPAAAGEEQPS